MWDRSEGTWGQKVYEKSQYYYEPKTALNINSILKREWGVKFQLPHFLNNEEMMLVLFCFLLHSLAECTEYAIITDYNITLKDNNSNLIKC